MARPEAIFFEETGHSVSFGFLRCCQTHDAVGIFGHPRTGGIIVQCFQGAHFSYRLEFVGIDRSVQLLNLVNW